MSARALSLRVALTTAAAAGLAAGLAPPRPARSVPAAVALLPGVLAAGALFAAGVRRRPRRPVGVGVGAFLLLGAANEEVIWRRVVLGELLRLGAPAALAASSLAFALAHRRGRPFQLATGAVFGGLYLATGSLAASVVAHWTFNLLVAAAGRRAPAALPP